MIRDTRPALLALLFVLAAAVVVLTATLVIDAADGRFSAWSTRWLAPAVLASSLAAAAAAAYLTNRHFKALERVRRAFVMLRADDIAVLPRPLDGSTPAEIERLRDAVDVLITQRHARQARPDDRLSAVLASVSEAIVVVTEAGQVSLVNAAAKRLLGEQRVAVGTSVFAALDRQGVENAIRAARGAGHPMEVALLSVDGAALAARVIEFDDHGGAIMTFAMENATDVAAFEYDLTLHDVPPAPLPFVGTTPLAELSVLVLDCETTGLDVGRDAIVAIGGVRMHGEHIYRGTTIDRLVDPGRPIPAHSSAIHGITDDLVRNAQRFRDVWTLLEPLMRGTVLVGHNVGFDIAHIRRATAEAGIAWTPPPALDTLLLVAALERSKDRLDLEVVAARYGISVTGRHTALGDSLVTAEIYARLLPQLQDRGIATLDAALRFTREAVQLVKLQRESGW